jgi:MFS family permease
MSYLSSYVRDWGELDPRVRRMAIARAINTGGMSLVMSFLGVYIVINRGYPAWQYGLCALAANIGQSMTSAWAGELSDRIGRRPLVTGSLLVRAGVIALLGVQVLMNMPLWSLALNFVASSMLRGCFEPVAYALVADVVTPEQRLAAYGMQRMGTNFGWALGPTIGGLLSVIVPYGVVFFFAAGGLVFAAWTTTGIPESRGVQSLERGRLRDALREAAARPAVAMLLCNAFLFYLVHTQLFSTFSIYMAGELHLSKLQIGLLYAINGAAVLILQIAAIRVVRRIGVNRALVIAGGVYVVGDLLVGISIGFATAAFAVIILTCAEIVLAPAQQTAAAELSDPQRRGRTFGVIEFAGILGVACAPLIGTTLYDEVGHHHLVMWGVIAGIASLLLVTGTLFGRLRRSHETSAV